MVFDLLGCEGLPLTEQPWSQRRMLLEQLQVDRVGVQTVATFEDGQTLFQVVCDRGLEGVVGKRERDPYGPGGRIPIGPVGTYG
jgi:bifunctional non-homologous end joining protein LigD